MNDEIIKLRERLVELSKDPTETRKLLDELTEAEIDNANIKSPFHVGEKDIIESKDFDTHIIHRTKDGFVIHYRAGYSILVKDNLISTSGAIQSLMTGVPADVTDKTERESIELANDAIEKIFRLPMFVFSHAETTFAIAEIAVRYMLLLQNIGEVPTSETDNPEYDKYLSQMNELLSNFAAGLEKEGKEYERRMGYAKTQDKSESESEGES